MLGGARRLVLLVALWAAVGIAVAVPARAGGLQRCRFVTGTLAVTPGLTDVPAAQTITVHGRLSGCSTAGGSGTFAATITMSHATCSSLSVALPPTRATFGWADGQRSLVSLTFPPLPYSPNKLALAGTVIFGAGQGANVDTGFHLTVTAASAHGSTANGHQGAPNAIRNVRHQLLDNRASGCTSTTPVDTIHVANDEGFEFNATRPAAVTTAAGGRIANAHSTRLRSTTTTARSTTTTVPRSTATYLPTRTGQHAPTVRAAPSVAARATNNSGGNGSVSFFDPVSLLAVGMIGGSVVGFVLLLVKHSTLTTRRTVVRRLQP